MTDWSDIGLGNLDLDSVEAAEEFVDTVGEGVFNCVVSDFVLDKSKSDRPRARFEFEIQDGEKAGKKFSEFQNNLDDPESLRYLKRRFLSLGWVEGSGNPTVDTFKGYPCVVTRTRQAKNPQFFNVRVSQYPTGAAVNHGQAVNSAPATPAQNAATPSQPQFGNLFG